MLDTNEVNFRVKKLNTYLNKYLIFIRFLQLPCSATSGVLTKALIARFKNPTPKP